MSLSPLERAPETPNSGELHEGGRKIDVAVAFPDSPEWSEAVKLEATTFMKRHYVMSSEELAAEYAPYLSETSMIIAKRTAASEVSGCARVIEYNSEIGFKTIDDALDEEKPLKIDASGWEVLEEIDHQNVYEVGTISAYHDSGAELYGAIIGHGLDVIPRRQYVIASLDEQVLTKRILPLFRDSVTILGPPADYMGSPTVPVLINLENAWENISGDEKLRPIFEKVANGREMVVREH